MNPNAKEFVPAHIQKKRQEEAEQVDGLARHLDRTGLNGKTRENGESSTTTTTTLTPDNDNNPKLGGDHTSQQQQQQQLTEKQEAQARSPASTTATSSSNNENNTENSSPTNRNAASKNNNFNSSNQTQINNEQNADRNDHDDCNGNAKEINPGHEEDDRYLLRAGEDICEFNGEQFIIPGDEYENDEEEFARHSAQPGYDFGNAEDNEDVDVCQAFDEFLDNLPE